MGFFFISAVQGMYRPIYLGGIGVFPNSYNFFVLSFC